MMNIDETSQQSVTFSSSTMEVDVQRRTPAEKSAVLVFLPDLGFILIPGGAK
jgi:hypothetical protein